MRRIFVGDVQGCREEFEALLEKVRFDPAADDLLLAGDLIRRGPESLATLELLQSLDARFVLGNHECHLLEEGFFEDSSPDADRWPSLHDLCALEPEERARWGRFLRSAPLLQAWPDLYLVHAALPPGLWKAGASEAQVRHWTDLRWDTKNQDLEDLWYLVTTRYCDAMGNKSTRDWPPPDPPYAPWDDFYKAERTVVFGHWARRGLVQKPRIRGLDTGCVYGGALTAWIAEEDRIVQVPARKAWVPV